MSLLTGTLLESVQISGKYYRIETDFRIWIAFSQLALSVNKNLAMCAEMFALVFKEGQLPPFTIETLTTILEFFNPFADDTGTKGDREKNRVRFMTLTMMQSLYIPLSFSNTI